MSCAIVAEWRDPLTGLHPQLPIVRGMILQAREAGDARHRILAIRRLLPYLVAGDVVAAAELRRLLVEAMERREEPGSVAAQLSQLTHPHVPEQAAAVAAAAVAALREGSDPSAIAASLRRCAWPAGRHGGLVAASIRLLSTLADDDYLLKTLGG